VRRLAVILLAASCGGCHQPIGPTADWVDAEAIPGVLRPEVASMPPVSAEDSGRAATPFLRVVTYNVLHGGDVDGLAQVFLDDPDLSRAGLLLLQEEESYPDEDGSRTARLAEALGMAYVYAPGREREHGTHGISILSAFPIENARVMELPAFDAGFAHHRRIALSADIRIDGMVLHVINVHLDTVLNVTDRILQLRPAVIEAPEVVLVGGDFNTNPYVWVDGTIPVLPTDSAVDTDQAPILDDYMRALDFDTPTSELGVTESNFYGTVRLDSIFTRGLDVEPGEVERQVDLSDHWPVWVDVML
jgi:endonuclease/exonuclease/phosphatase family metal-dependent hydrolase